jgi:hypothetical protein
MLKLDRNIKCEMLDGFEQLKEAFEDTKGVIRIRISKNRQPNDQKNKDKQRSTKHTNKTKDRVIQTSLNTCGELSAKTHC